MKNRQKEIFESSLRQNIVLYKKVREYSRENTACESTEAWGRCTERGPGRAGAVVCFVKVVCSHLSQCLGQRDIW